jgi:serine/threonine protein kinase
MPFIHLGDVVGSGSFGIVFRMLIDFKPEPGFVMKIFASLVGPEGGELVTSVSLFTEDKLTKDADYIQLTWDFLTGLVPEIAARGAQVTDLDMRHYLLYVANHGLMWGAVMPEVRPMSFILYSTFTEDQRLKFAEGIPRALKKVHSEGFIHGDVKPDNFALLPDNTVILLDFGLFTAAPCVVKNRGAIFAEEFRAPEFSAPEDSVLLVTQAADVWAGGITLLALENGGYLGTEVLRRLKLTSSVNDNLELLKTVFPKANSRILDIAASMLIADPALRCAPYKPPPAPNAGASYVGMLPYDQTCAVFSDIAVIIDARDALDRRTLTNWEITRLIGCSVDLFFRAYATGITKHITYRLLNCACLSIASVISNLGGRFVLCYPDFRRVEADLNFTSKDLLCAILAVVDALGGKLMPPHKGVNWGLGTHELSNAEGEAAWHHLVIWSLLPQLVV